MNSKSYTAIVYLNEAKQRNPMILYPAHERACEKSWHHQHNPNPNPHLITQHLPNQPLRHAGTPPTWAHTFSYTPTFQRKGGT